MAQIQNAPRELGSRRVLARFVIRTTILVAFVWLLARPYRRPAGGGATQGTRPLIRMSAYATTVAVLIAMPVVVYTFVTRLDARMAPLVPTISANRSGVRQPLPMLSHAPSPSAGNHGMPANCGHIRPYSPPSAVIG